MNKSKLIYKMKSKYYFKLNEKRSDWYFFLQKTNKLSTIQLMRNKKIQQFSIKKDLKFFEKIKQQFTSKIFKICQLFNYSDNTFYQSYRIFVRMTHTMTFPMSEIEHLSYLCLMLSSKFNETPDKILTPQLLSEICSDLTLEKIINLEMKIYFNLDCYFITVCEKSFLDVYLELDQTIVPADLIVSKISIQLFRTKFQIQSKYLLHLYIFSEFYGQFKPEMVAICIIIILRAFNDYNDIIFTNFRDITGREPHELDDCLNVLKVLFEENCISERNRAIWDGIGTGSETGA